MTSLQLPADSKHAWTSASKAAKRLMDLVGGLGGLILFSPMIALFAVLIRLESKGPVFIREGRIGMAGTEFIIRRYRIQSGDQGTPRLDPFQPWMSRTGAYLERTGLEYLPVLLNVIRGEMSLIGPRPFTLAEGKIVAREDPSAYSIRNSVPPGLFGPWQLLGRFGTDLPLMVQIDLDYINRWSLVLDLGFMFQTFVAMILK